MARTPPFHALQADLALPSSVRGPVDFVHGHKARIRSACRWRVSGVQRGMMRVWLSWLPCPAVNHHESRRPHPTPGRRNIKAIGGYKGLHQDTRGYTICVFVGESDPWRSVSDVFRRAKYLGLRAALLPLLVVAACCREGALLLVLALWGKCVLGSIMAPPRCRRSRLLARKRQQGCTQSKVLRTPPHRRWTRIRIPTETTHPTPRSLSPHPDQSCPGPRPRRM